MDQILQNKRLKLTIIFFMTLFLSLSAISVFAGEKFCPYCGEEISPDARFCSYCGQELGLERRTKIRRYGIGIGYGRDLNTEDTISLSLYFDYVSESGFGYQLNIAYYYTRDRTHLYVKEEPLLAVYKQKEIFFVSPMIIKYQFGKASSISPYLGAGLCYSWYEYEDTSTSPWIQDKWDGIVPVFCWGITFFSNSPVEVSWDGKYFLNPHYFKKGSAFFLSILVSLNW